MFMLLWFREELLWLVGHSMYMNTVCLCRSVVRSLTRTKRVRELSVRANWDLCDVILSAHPFQVRHGACANESIWNTVILYPYECCKGGLNNVRLYEVVSGTMHENMKFLVRYCLLNRLKLNVNNRGYTPHIFCAHFRIELKNINRAFVGFARSMYSTTIKPTRTRVECKSAILVRQTRAHLHYNKCSMGILINSLPPQATRATI